MAVNLSAISNAQTTAGALGGLILVTPNQNLGYQPQNAPITPGRVKTGAQPPSLVFDYEGENTVTVESDITDHYIEDNTAIQDQIALKPLTVTVGGYIGELNDVVPSLLAPLKFIADKLTVLGAYTPVLSETAIIAYNEASQAYAIATQLAASAVSAWNAVTGSGPTQNKQQTAFQQFYGYYNTRTLFTIQTPWAIFQNMAIMSLRAVQDPETRVISEFEIKFKQMRFASTSQALAINPANTQGRLASQSSTPVDNGVQTPTVSPIEFGAATGGIA